MGMLHKRLILIFVLIIIYLSIFISTNLKNITGFIIVDGTTIPTTISTTTTTVYTINMYFNIQPSDTGRQLVSTCSCASSSCTCKVQCYNDTYCANTPGASNYGKAETYSEDTMLSSSSWILLYKARFNSSTFSLNSSNAISLSFDNLLQENVAVIFIIANEQGLVTSYSSETAPSGSGLITKSIICSSLGAGNYTVSWEAYLQSDNKFLNAKAWSKPNEWKRVICK
jgi:hypothetical protein